MFNRFPANHPSNIIHESNGSYTVNVSGDSSITISEVRKANTKSARSELSKRVRKPTPIDQSQQDADWERLQAHIKAQSDKKSVSEGTGSFSEGVTGKRRPADVRKAISRAMKGQSNFEGKSHTKKSKIAIQIARGHDDRIGGKKWSYDKDTGKTTRTNQLPNDHKWGRGSSTANRTKRKLSSFGK